jgi:predicted DNA-binding protein
MYQNETMTFRLSTSDKDELKALSNQQRKHPSMLIREVLAAYIQTAKQQIARPYHGQHLRTPTWESTY